jgi:nucleoside-diphosphate-sugar epimerase
MKALVTGGAGFIGSHIVEELLARKHEVRVLDDLSTGSMENLPKRGVDFMKGSITDRAALEKSMKGVEVVFHEAAQVSVARSMEHPKETWETNIRGTKLLLNAAVEAGAKRVVFASSAAVYGNAIPPLREGKEPKPISPYGDSKRMGELLMEEYAKKERISTVSLRYANVYGPRQDPGSSYSGVISKFIDRMSKGERPVIFGNGMQTRDFIFVKDVARANMLAMEARKVKGVYNIATGSGITINELVKTLNSVLSTQLEPMFEAEKQGDIKYSWADASLAKDKLGFEARTSLTDGLKETVAWYRQRK